MKQLRISIFALSLACGLIAIAIGQSELLGWRVEAVSQLAISPSVQELGRIPKGELRLVVFHVTNRSRDRNARLIGATNSCGPLGCITINGLPMTISPGESVRLEVEYEGTRPGRSARVARVFTDSPSQAEIPFTIVADILSPN